MASGGGTGPGGRRFAEYANLSRNAGAVVSSGLATLHELDTVYSVEDLYLLLEVVMVDSNNRRVASEEPK